MSLVRFDTSKQVSSHRIPACQWDRDCYSNVIWSHIYSCALHRTISWTTGVSFGNYCAILIIIRVEPVSCHSFRTFKCAVISRTSVVSRLAGESTRDILTLSGSDVCPWKDLPQRSRNFHTFYNFSLRRCYADPDQIRHMWLRLMFSKSNQC